MKIIPVTVALTILLLSGVAHGLKTGRWWESHELPAAVARLDHVPREAGDWSGQDVAADPRQLAIAGAVGYVSRRYEDRSTGRSVAFLLLCGRPGPLSVHTPEVCYAGAGCQPIGEPAKRIVRPTDGGPPGEFWAHTFLKGNAAESQKLRVLYSWNPRNGWAAADYPRLSFATAESLYKLYVVSEIDDEEVVSGKDACQEFLKAFLPTLNKSLSKGA
jgi:hypothetical protein